MTPNDIATNWIAMKDFCRCCRSTYHQQQLAQAYLTLESRISKLEAVAEAARKVMDICDEPWGELEASVWSILEDDYAAYYCRDLLFEALSELDQP